MLKKVILTAVFALLLASPMFAVQSVYGTYYKQGPTSVKTAVSGTVYTIFTTTDTAIYKNRVFSLKNTFSTGTLDGTVEASLDGTSWATVDASSLGQVAAGKAKHAKVVDNCAPYWRIRVANNAGTTGTAEGRFIGLSN